MDFMGLRSWMDPWRAAPLGKKGSPLPVEVLQRTPVKIAQTVVITGVAGFLGRYVSRQFASEGWRIVGLDDSAAENVSLGAGATYHRMRLPDPRFREMLEQERPQALIHCAGRASVPLSMENPA